MNPLGTFLKDVRETDEEATVATTRNLWVPAVNNAGTWGRWAFIEIADPWDAKSMIRAFVAALMPRTVGEQE